MTALDFSYARPGGIALANNNVTSVGRYVGTDRRCITLDELTDYLNNDVSVWCIKENNARGMLNGYGQGLADALSAQQELNKLGHSNAVVYYTADFDIQPSQFAIADEYLAGVKSVMDISRVGLYAGTLYLNHAQNLVSYYWKTGSISWDHGQTPNMKLHLIQTLDAVPIPNTDYNIIVQAEHGQIGSLGTDTTGLEQTLLPIIIPTRGNKVKVISLKTNNDGTPNGSFALVSDTKFLIIAPYTATGMSNIWGPIIEVTQDEWAFANKFAITPQAI